MNWNFLLSHYKIPAYLPIVLTKECNSMDKKDIKEYNDSIRRMLEHEDMIRSQRTNWFLVIQGLLINAILIVLKIEDFKFRAIAVSLLLIIGTLVSLSFLYAAYLSSKASSEGEKIWIKILKENKGSIGDFPPICLLAKYKIQNNEYKKDPKDKLLPCIFLPIFFSILEGVLFIWTLYLIIAEELPHVNF